MSRTSTASGTGVVWTTGYIDECHLFLSPVVVGGGKQVPPDAVRLDLELLDERRFGNGLVYLRYQIK
jgi:riboflavin biosynthesis pyrimidine reductase